MKRFLAAALVGLAALATVATASAQQAAHTLPYCLSLAGKVVPCPLQDMQPVPGVTPPFAAPTADQKAQVIAVSPNSGRMSHASVTALGTSLVAKPSPGLLGGFNCTAVTGGAAGFCIAYNGASVPNTGALTGSLVLDACAFDTGTKGCSLSRIPSSVLYSTGIVILVTSASTPFTYTTGTDTAFISADYQ